ncbi:MAG: K(+)-transporting ATPase subunit F [Candidatus Methylomirabilota bacterium]|nr:K(+)-transporting ATPase subunit F [Candidatus Methylomirabilis sp.]NJD69157.1 K(+)-transporting ATPase subunit F [candidate division NC10 bacterium]PWB47567.1 MAG: K(+)-transporting ATPase subunit F [candidate division NC10 bacterium]
MTSLYWLGGIVALGLLIYLVVALLKPEVFS